MWNTILSFSIWGEGYAEKFCLLALDSIKKDLIETYQKHKVQMVLFVNQSANDILKKDSNFIELDKLDIVKIIIIPNDIFQSEYYLERITVTRYYVFGFIQNICWRFSAIKEINLSLLTPDNYYSKNFFKNLLVKIDDNKDDYYYFRKNLIGDFKIHADYIQGRLTTFSNDPNFVIRELQTYLGKS